MLGEVLNETIIAVLNEGDDFVEEAEKLDLKSRSLYQQYAQNFDIMSEDFNLEFLSHFDDMFIENSAATLIKDINDLWKLLYFLLEALQNVSCDKLS